MRNAAEYVGIGVFLRQSDSGISDSDRAVIDAEVNSLLSKTYNILHGEDSVEAGVGSWSVSARSPFSQCP